MNDPLNPMPGMDESEEDDFEDELVMGDFELVCVEIECGRPCVNGGKCVMVNPTTGQMQVCDHLSLDDNETFEANN